MSDPTTAKERLLDLISLADAMNQGTTPEQAVADAIAEGILNQPSLRTCLVPGCLRQYDVMSCMAGDPPPRPEWSGTGWATLGHGSIFPAGGHICPDHRVLVTDHFPRRIKLPNDRWTVDCACDWMPASQTWHGLLRALWEQHLLTVMGKLPTAPPIPDPDVPGTRLPLAEHTEDTLTELYDRLWDAESEWKDVRDFGRAAFLAYQQAVPALLGVQHSIEALRARMVVDSRDWTADKLDAWLWALLVGANCEDDTEGHRHNDIDCNGDQALWDLARLHGISTEDTIRAGHLRWWIANAIKVAQQIKKEG